MRIDAMAPEKRPSACIACGKCKVMCPQNIDIPETLKTFQSILDQMPHWANMRQGPEELQELLH